MRWHGCCACGSALRRMHRAASDLGSELGAQRSMAVVDQSSPCRFVGPGDPEYVWRAGGAVVAATVAAVSCSRVGDGVVDGVLDGVVDGVSACRDGSVRTGGAVAAWVFGCSFASSAS